MELGMGFLQVGDGQPYPVRGNTGTATRPSHAHIAYLAYLWKKFLPTISAKIILGRT